MPEPLQSMIHPDFPNRQPAQTTLTAYYATHMDKGWKLVGAEGDVEVVTETKPALSKLKVGELKDLAGELGIEGYESMKKAGLIDAIESNPAYYL